MCIRYSIMWYNWNIVEGGFTYHTPPPHTKKILRTYRKANHTHVTCTIWIYTLGQMICNLRHS
jgi:hypothetical protein